MSVQLLLDVRQVGLHPPQTLHHFVSLTNNLNEYCSYLVKIEENLYSFNLKDTHPLNRLPGGESWRLSGRRFGSWDVEQQLDQLAETFDGFIADILLASPMNLNQKS
jgi:hypothetical protein